MPPASTGGSEQALTVAEALPAEPTIMYVIKQLEAGIRNALDEVLRPTGVTALQYTALTALQRRPDMTQSDLARFSFIRPQSAADLVSALSQRGLISRRTDPARRRRLLISLTPEGRAFLAEHAARIATIEERMLDGLDGTQRSELLGALRACRNNIRLHSPQFRIP
jgi:DNA-binding MarR family transcriptional regulator